MIKPIETLYNGIRFRSRLEARWAIVFEEFGIEYCYEYEGFKNNEYYYLPDFYFPQINAYGEVKPREFTEEEHRKMSANIGKNGINTLLLFGNIPVEADKILIKTICRLGDKDNDDLIGHYSRFDYLDENKILSSKYYDNLFYEVLNWKLPFDSADLEQDCNYWRITNWKIAFSYEKAREAQFNYGQRKGT